MFGKYSSLNSLNILIHDTRTINTIKKRLISVYEVRLAIDKAKSGKAAGPSGVAADMLKAAEEA